MTDDQRFAIRELPYNPELFQTTADRLGIPVEQVVQIWSRGHPERKFCACGNLAYRYKNSDYICERCDRIEQQMYEEESYCHQPRAFWERYRADDKYAEVYEVSSVKGY